MRCIYTFDVTSIPLVVALPGKQKLRTTMIYVCHEVLAPNEWQILSGEGWICIEMCFSCQHTMCVNDLSRQNIWYSTRLDDPLPENVDKIVYSWWGEDKGLMWYAHISTDGLHVDGYLCNPFKNCFSEKFTKALLISSKKELTMKWFAIDLLCQI